MTLWIVNLYWVAAKNEVSNNQYNDRCAGVMRDEVINAVAPGCAQYL